MNVDTPKKYHWLREGTLVDYHGVIGGPVTIAGLTVRGEPFPTPTPRGYRGKPSWCVMLNGKSGWVACDALTRASPSEHGGATKEEM